MKLHGNAALSLKKRRLLCQRVSGEGWSLTKAAEAAEVSERTAGKWVRRFQEEGEAGLVDLLPLRTRSTTGRPSRASRRSQRCGVSASQALQSRRSSRCPRRRFRAS